MRKYVCVTFKKVDTHYVYAQVETDLSGSDLLDAVAVPTEWMEGYFGRDEAGEWEVDEVQEMRPEYPFMTDSHYASERKEAPVFEIDTEYEEPLQESPDNR